MADQAMEIRFASERPLTGHATGENHGVDTDAEGNRVVTDYRFYQLVRQERAVTDHIFEIEFEDPGIRALSLTFG